MPSVLLDQPTLVPVVELEPNRFGSMDMPPDLWNDDAAFSYWIGCLAQSGLGHLRPVTKRSWLVRLSDLLEPSTLRIVLEMHLERCTDLTGERSPIPLAGGIALFRGSYPIFLPRCCSNLAGLDEWELAAKHRSSDPAMVWIGHPWIEVRFQSPHLLLSETSEDNAALDPADSFLVYPHALSGAATGARVLLSRHSSEIVAPLLEVMEIAAPIATANALLGIGIAST